MRLELYWLEPDGTWQQRSVQSAEVFEFRGVKCAVHRPLSGAPCTWCVTEVTKGLSIVNFILGTKRDAISAAHEVLRTKSEEQWKTWLARFNVSKLH